jgi:hypothetical protein
MVDHFPEKLDVRHSGGAPEAVSQLIEESLAASKGRELLESDWIETPIGAVLAVADTNRTASSEVLRW